MGAVYKRVVLKISGESIRENNADQIIAHALLHALGQQIIAIYELGIELAIVIGGGNIFRGHTYNGRHSGLTRTNADKMGMLATTINAIALSDILETYGIDVLIQSAIAIEGIVPRFSIDVSDRALKSGKIVIFCCGTGNPFFSTDSAAALRACELRADILLKATTIDGVYDDDPYKNTHAQKFKQLSYEEVLKRNLNVMDQTAFVLCMENHIPIRIFSIKNPNGIADVFQDLSVGTFIGNR
ncbi:MAG: UMP kinase [Puniceicoccales bacterium]|nr:UMP kinase [Puniceicoccales bacterium]